MRNLIRIKAIIFFIFLCLGSFVLTAQPATFHWANSSIGDGKDFSNGIFTDQNKNSYIVGYFTSPTLAFGAYTLVNQGKQDLFIVKYNSKGQVEWAISSGGTEKDDARGICGDSKGNIYVIGSFFSSSISFGSITLNKSGLWNSVSDVYVVKINSLGNISWAKSYGGTQTDIGTGICLDANNNIFICGHYSSSDFVLGNEPLPNKGLYDIFIAKFDNSGNVLWGNSANSGSWDWAWGINTDKNGNVLLWGDYTFDAIDFDSISLPTLGGPYTGCIAKYNNNGNIEWAKPLGDIGSTYISKIVPDNFGNLFIGGFYNSPSLTIDTLVLSNKGDYDMFFMKSDALGNPIWAKSIGGSGWDDLNNFCIDDSSNLYLTGFYGDSINFGNTSLTSNGMWDVFLSKYDKHGNAKWAKSFGGAYDDSGVGISCTNSGSDIFLTGTFSSPTIACDSFSLNNPISNDTCAVFVAQLNQFTVSEAPDNDSKLIFQIYPNPTNGVINIITSVELNSASIVISDLAGKVVRLMDNLNGNKIVVQGNSLSTGLYFVRLIINDRELYKNKIIITR